MQIFLVISGPLLFQIKLLLQFLRFHKNCCICIHFLKFIKLNVATVESLAISIIPVSPNIDALAFNSFTLQELQQNEKPAVLTADGRFSTMLGTTITLFHSTPH